MQRLNVLIVAVLLGLCLGMAGCDESNLPANAAAAPNPKLMAPTKSLIPTVNVATAKGWPEGAAPQPEASLSVGVFAAQLDHPRWLLLPNGDVLVAETNAPKATGRGTRDQGLDLTGGPKAGGGRRSQRQSDQPLRDGDGIAFRHSGLTFSQRPSCLTMRSEITSRRLDLSSAWARYCRSVSGATPLSASGSWNRKPRSGYKVTFVRFEAERPKGEPIDVLTGFVSAEDEALGRPVSVVMEKTGALLVANDVGNTIWRVTSATPLAALSQ